MKPFWHSQNQNTQEVRNVSTACFVESVHFFLVILVILLTAEPVRILKMEVPQVSNFEFFTAEPLKFHYC